MLQRPQSSIPAGSEWRPRRLGDEGVAMTRPEDRDRDRLVRVTSKSTCARGISTRITFRRRGGRPVCAGGKENEASAKRRTRSILGQ